MGVGSKAKLIVENVFLTTAIENLQQTQRLQYSRQYNLQVLASVVSTKSAVKPSILEVYSHLILDVLFWKLNKR